MTMDNQPELKKSNPLAGFFRHPAIHLRLPSKGRFWPDNALDMPLNEELEIYPMTTKDEITLRTPDALLNGSGIVSIIQSCVPNIKDAWQTPSVDVDALLIAIRIATYGEELDFDTTCPHCKAENAHAIDLRTILDSIACPDYSQKIEYETIKIKLKPQAYFTANKVNMISFEEQKIIQVLNDSTLDADIKGIEINKSMQKLADLRIDTVTDSTEYIELEDGTIVTNREHIFEFYENAENKVVKNIQKILADVGETVAIQPKQTSCTDCGEEYSVPIDFNYSNFFGKSF
jgi:predicted Zn-ribbon and HTH transcriptional regulator